MLKWLRNSFFNSKEIRPKPRGRKKKLEHNNDNTNTIQETIRIKLNEIQRKV